MIFKPAWALKASISALVWRIIFSIGRSNWKFTGLTWNLVLASASGLLFCFFMLLVVLVCSFISLPSLSARQPNHQPLFQLFKGHFPGGFCASDLQTGLISWLESGLGVALVWL